METNISSIDIGIVISYFVVVLLIGFYIARQTKTGEDLFLGGRSFGWGIIGLSLFASNISSSTIIGLSGAAYTTGIATSVYEWMSGIPLIIAATIFVPLYLRSQITTIPEFLELRFDRRSQLFFSGITIFSTIMIETAGGLYAGTIVLKAFFPGLNMAYTSLGLAFVAALYTASGGLKAVVYTDAIQAVILIFGCSILTYILLAQIDFDFARILASAPAEHFSVVRPMDDESLPWLGLLVGVPFMGFWYWSTNQYIVQRVLGGKNIRHARWGVIFAGFLKIIPLFVMVIPGAIALSLYPDIEKGDQVFPFLVTNVLPVGLVGLVLAGLISAIMSSVDSALNSSSTLVVVDFIKPHLPDITNDQLVQYGRITTFVLMIIAAVWAPQIGNFSGLWDYLQQMFSIIVPPIVVIFLVGVFFKRGNGDGAFWTLMIGTAIGVLLFILGEQGFWPLHFTVNVGFMIVVCTIIFVVVSLLTPAPDAAKISKLTYRKGLVMDGMEGYPWYQDYRLYMVILTGLILCILAQLW